MRAPPPAAVARPPRSSSRTTSTWRSGPARAARVPARWAHLHVPDAGQVRAGHRGAAGLAPGLLLRIRPSIYFTWRRQGSLDITLSSFLPFTARARALSVAPAGASASECGCPSPTRRSKRAAKPSPASIRITAAPSMRGSFGQLCNVRHPPLTPVDVSVLDLWISPWQPWARIRRTRSSLT